MKSSLVFVAGLVCWAMVGSWLSNVNVDACSRGSLMCGTAWWLIGTIALALAGLVRAVNGMGRQPSPSQQEASRPDGERG